jgi:hypothetical protein
MMPGSRERWWIREMVVRRKRMPRAEVTML